MQRDQVESPAAGVRSGLSSSRSNNQTSEAWFEYGSSKKSSSAGNNNNNNNSGGGGPTTPSGASRMNTSHDWFKHDDGSRTPQKWPPGPDQQPSGKIHRARRSDEAKRNMETTLGHDPNDWYRHDHDPNETPGQGVVEPLRPGKKMTSPEKRQSGNGGGKAAAGTASGSTTNGSTSASLWFAHDERHGRADVIHSEADGTDSPRNRHTAPEAEANYQRNKLGSGADWFPHEHDPSPAPPATGACSPGGPRGPPRESDEIARRLKVESEDWYSHDASTAPAQPPASPVRHGATAEVRRMIARDSGDEVRQILRVDENLQKRSTTSSPPPPLQSPAAPVDASS